MSALKLEPESGERLISSCPHDFTRYPMQIVATAPAHVRRCSSRRELPDIVKNPKTYPWSLLARYDQHGVATARDQTRLEPPADRFIIERQHIDPINLHYLKV
jgi:hypothetical protein